METLSFDGAGSAHTSDIVTYYSDSSAWRPNHERASHRSSHETQRTRKPYTIPTIRIFTLGRFSILLDNQTADFSSNGQKKSLELLKTLIAFGGREVGEVRLCEALWPDSDGDVAHTTFSVTLHRLRKLIGSEALLLNDSRLTLNPDVCWVDAWEYERTIGEIKHLLHIRPMDPQHISKLVQRAIDIYHGPYLGNEDEQPWFLTYRDRLHNKFVRCLLDVCACLEKHHRYDEASQLYEAGLDIDDLCESIYVKLMACYHNLGRRAQAMKVYQRCQSVIKAHWGVEPSSELQTLFESLKKCA
ncbi:MAG: bacterial transcriptional activator domain-containing protein [Gammaproteobacteria bacterium]|jgi:two-component SAPR family response regulator|nr:bacterial transcriptional activator domain-containing protein [Gammaproteobacteria bacterium]